MMPVRRNNVKKSSAIKGLLLLVAGVLAVLGPGDRPGVWTADEYIAEVQGSGTKPLDRSVIDAIVASLPRHSIPFVVNQNDGYTFAMAQQSQDVPPPSPPPNSISGSFSGRRPKSSSVIRGTFKRRSPMPQTAPSRSRGRSASRSDRPWSTTRRPSLAHLRSSP